MPPIHQQTCRRGFTLIELIVTVIIVGVLTAVAGLAYNAFTDETRSQALLAAAAAVYKAVAAHSANGDLAPTTVVRNANVHPAGLSARLGIDVTGRGLTLDSPTTPTRLTVTRGTRKACLVLGTDPGRSSAVSVGACSALRS